MKDNTQNKIIKTIYDFILFITLFSLIIVRLILWNKDVNWIWILNYLGMAIASFNLLINRIVGYKDVNYSFLGLLIIVIIIEIILFFVINFLQSTSYVDLINDVITLLAILFSISPSVWDVILNIIEQYI
jgi:hypothetical protein